MQARRNTALVPIRVEFETETHRIRDCFVWNLNEDIIKPDTIGALDEAHLDHAEDILGIVAQNNIQSVSISPLFCSL